MMSVVFVSQVRRRPPVTCSWRAPVLLSTLPLQACCFCTLRYGPNVCSAAFLFLLFYFSFKAIIMCYLVNFTSSLFSQFFCVSGYNLGIYLGIELTIILNCYQLFSILAFFLYNPFLSSNLINLKYISYLVSLTTLQFVFLFTPWETFGTSYGFMYMILFTIILDSTTLLLLWAICCCFSSIS